MVGVTAEEVKALRCEVPNLGWDPPIQWLRVAVRLEKRGLLRRVQLPWPDEYGQTLFTYERTEAGALMLRIFTGGMIGFDV